jgi:hypothetical protein
MLKSFATSEMATQFHQAYYQQLLREVLAVMTDTFHTPGFKLHCRILLHLFGIVRGETIIKAPLWDLTVRLYACVKLQKDAQLHVASVLVAIVTHTLD